MCNLGITLKYTLQSFKNRNIAKIGRKSASEQETFLSRETIIEKLLIEEIEAEHEQFYQCVSIL